VVRLRPISDVSKMINMDPEWRGWDLVKGVGTTSEPIWPGTPSKFSHAQSQGSRASLLYLLWEFFEPSGSRGLCACSDSNLGVAPKGLRNS